MNMSRTKIIVTLGPVSSNRAVITQMIHEGVDVFRLNFSHGSREQHAETIGLIREISSELNANIAILVDLQGPKIRIGELENNRVNLEEGGKVVITTDSVTGTSSLISVGYPGFARDVENGETVLLDDGKIKLQVLDTDHNTEVLCKVVHGGTLLPRKGVNLPDTKLSLPSLTPKDIEDTEFLIGQMVDWVALSFVRKAGDIIALKDFIQNKGSNAKVVAKIEKPEALRDIDNIIHVSDAVMIARGDLGVELPFDHVPLIQKELVKKCIVSAKPVIIATQMLESMIANFNPTRAEVNDVANAVLDGADTLMLSAETSIGKYPVQAVKNMQKIVTYTEEKAYRFYLDHEPMKGSADFLPHSICFNAQKMAGQTNARALITFTHSGNTVFQVASHRPKAKIFAFTDDEVLLRQLTLVWGVEAFKLSLRKSTDEFFDETTVFLEGKGLLHKGDIVVHIGSIPIPEKSKTNMMKISRV